MIFFFNIERYYNFQNSGLSNFYFMKYVNILNALATKGKKPDNKI